MVFFCSVNIKALTFSACALSSNSFYVGTFGLGVINSVNLEGEAEAYFPLIESFYCNIDFNLSLTYIYFANISAYNYCSA